MSSAPVANTRNRIHRPHTEPRTLEVHCFVSEIPLSSANMRPASCSAQGRKDSSSIIPRTDEHSRSSDRAVPHSNSSDQTITTTATTTKQAKKKKRETPYYQNAATKEIKESKSKTTGAPIRDSEPIAASLLGGSTHKCCVFLHVEEEAAGGFHCRVQSKDGGREDTDQPAEHRGKEQALTVPTRRS